MKIFTYFLATGLAIAIVGGFLLGVTIWQVGRDLPDHEHMRDYAPPIMSRAHAADGTLIAEYAQERRLFVPFNVMPDHLVKAFLAAEDKNFYTHFGIDVFGLARAVITNIRNVFEGRRLVGASTITQQVARNFLLTRDVTLQRKLKEAILAIRLERAFRKDELLELYLNEIYLGLGNYGVAAAALNYFDKSLSELTLAEAAYIAALPKGPFNYHPIKKKKRAIARRNWVLYRMHINGYISKQDAEQAQQEDLIVSPRKFLSRRFSAEYFVEEIRRQVFGFYGEKKLYGGGLSIRSTLETDYQRIATSALRAGLEKYDKRHGYRGPVTRLETLINWRDSLAALSELRDVPEWRLAVILDVAETRLNIGLRPEETGLEGGGDVVEKGDIDIADAAWVRPISFNQRNEKQIGKKINSFLGHFAIGDVVWISATDRKGYFALEQYPLVNGGIVALDPHTGRILAMGGGYSFAKSEFNRVTQAQRQPGSAIKPFIYASALDQGYTPVSIVLDAPFVIEQTGGDQDFWKPKNYGGRYYGPSTLRLGLENSRNLMTIRLAEQIGMDKISNYIERFEIMERVPPVLSIALGAGETTLLKLSSAYASLVNGGKKVTPVLIDRIQDRYGKTIYKYDRRPCNACNQLQWANASPPVLPDIKQQILSPQTAYQIVSMLEGAIERGTGRSVRAVGKTVAGKTGTTNDSRDAWFIGFSPDLVVGVYIGFDNNQPLGNRETGGRAAAPIFKDFMKEVLKREADTPFRIPPGINLVRVDARSGKPAQSGDEKVILEAFKIGTDIEKSRLVNEKGNSGGSVIY